MLLDLAQGVLEKCVDTEPCKLLVSGPCHPLLLMGALRYMVIEVRIVLIYLGRSVLAGTWHVGAL